MVKVVKGLPTEWGVCSRTVFLSRYTWTLSYHDGAIAVGSEYGDIIILNSITGTQKAVLSGHTALVYCVEFSSDGTLLVSGGHDNTVKLWDMQTGGVVRTFYGHNDWVTCVSISVDCTKIASGSEDKAIYLWDIQSGKCYYTIEGHDIAHQIRFSPTNPQYFISMFRDEETRSIERIWQWDTNGHQIKPPHDGSGIGFSPDGTQFVSFHKAAVTVWNSNSGVIMSTFQVGDDNTRCCCFSPDGRLVAIAAGRIVYIWNITSLDPCLVRTFIGHTHEVTSVVFSSPSTLISASFDNSVKFWQVYTSSAEPVMSRLESAPIALPLVSSISLQARDGIAISSDAAGVVKTWDISTSLHEISTKSSTRFILNWTRPSGKSKVPLSSLNVDSSTYERRFQRINLHCQILIV